MTTNLSLSVSDCLTRATFLYNPVSPTDFLSPNDLALVYFLIGLSMERKEIMYCNFYVNVTVAGRSQSSNQWYTAIFFRLQVFLNDCSFSLQKPNLKSYK